MKKTFSRNSEFDNFDSVKKAPGPLNILLLSKLQIQVFFKFLKNWLTWSYRYSMKGFPLHRPMVLLVPGHDRTLSKLFWKMGQIRGQTRGRKPSIIATCLKYFAVYSSMVCFSCHNNSLDRNSNVALVHRDVPLYY